jgi:hypothetical protein
MAIATTKLEKDLYPPVTALLEELGMRVWEEATIRAGDEGTRTADHVAWRWDGDDLETWAVEVKPGELSVGLAQAVAYAVGFDRVLVAAEEPLAEAGYMGKVLERLGLGYIRVDREAATATLEREPTPSVFVSEPVKAENDARVRLKHLFTEDVLGEPVRFGADRRGDNWAVTGTTSEWQLCGQVVEGTGSTWLSLLAESKSVGDAAASRLDAFELATWTASLGDAEIVLQRRHHDGFKGSYSGPLETWTPADSVEKLGALLSTARALSAPRVGPQFQITASLWPHGVSLAEDQARREFLAAVERFRLIQQRLNERVSR